MPIHTHILAAHDAIGAAVKRAGPTLEITELIGAMIAVFTTQPGIMGDAVAGAVAKDLCSSRLTILVVEMVGERRAHELVDKAYAVGAGREPVEANEKLCEALAESLAKKTGAEW